jgi:HK97 family phage prohead protease
MISKDREYRAFEMRASSEGEMIVEGYAAVFNTPTVLYSYDGIDYKESVDAEAFRKAEMADVVMNYNHEGKPVARTKNGTLALSVDDHGLFAKADLSGTEEGRRLYEEIKGGYIDKMSFAFVVSEDSYDRDTHTRTIRGIKRLYDVAAVDIPAYDATEISARSHFSAEAEFEKAEAERRKKALKLKLTIMEVLK